jgi:hypothetical protein
MQPPGCLISSPAMSVHTADRASAKGQSLRRYHASTGSGPRLDLQPSVFKGMLGAPVHGICLVVEAARVTAQQNFDGVPCGLGNLS